MCVHVCLYAGRFSSGLAPSLCVHTSPQVPTCLPCALVPSIRPREQSCSAAESAGLPAEGGRLVPGSAAWGRSCPHLWRLRSLYRTYAVSVKGKAESLLFQMEALAGKRE